MNELLVEFKRNVLLLVNNYNELITQIKRSNTSIRIKNINISNAIRNYNNAVAALKTKHMAFVE